MTTPSGSPSSSASSAKGFKPDRDLILALTADEEGGLSNGVDWLIKNHRELIDAEFVLNSDGGGVDTENGKPVIVSMDASEKLYADFQLTVTNPGGHSSLPVPDNAIYHLADALVRLEHFQFPLELNDVTRAYFERMASVETGQEAADMRAILNNPPDPAAAARLSLDPLQNADAAHHLRGHAAGCGTRQQRPSPKRPRQRELPHSARTHARRGSADPHPRLRRSQGGGRAMSITAAVCSIARPTPRPCRRSNCGPT